MKKKIILIILVILFALACSLGAFYVWGMGAVSNEGELKTFVIEPGTSKSDVVKNLESAGLIRSQYPVLAYLFFRGGNIQAGEYELSTNMKPTDMIQKFVDGDVLIHSLQVTLVEGKRLTDYADVLSENLKFTAEEFLTQANDRAFLEELVSTGDYWFLTNEILNEELYYPLEGYLYPDTYEFLETASPKEVILTLLNHTETKLEPYKESILNSEYTFHEILTLASMVEKEANSESDRQTVAQVFFTRLEENWSLGSDVTTYYGAHKEIGVDELTWNELNDSNPYNTRLTDGSMNGKLPIGPICNPSIISIAATLSPSDTNYYYFVANVCTGEVFFQTTSEEFYQKNLELSNTCAAN